MKVMNLQDRLKAAADHAIKTKRSAGARKWTKEMAKAAGCSYQNVRQAVNGLQSEMKPEFLRKIAEWAGVSSEWLIHDIGQMVESVMDDREVDNLTSHLTPFTGNAYSDTKPILAPVLAWARLGTDLFKGSSDVQATQALSMPFGASTNAKWFIAEEPMPRFGIRIGYKVAIDPIQDDLKQHDEGRTYLFVTVTGKFFLGDFRSLGEDEFEAIPDSGPPLDSVRHKIKVVGKYLGSLV
ncbi:MAG TPA: helix-turn-helix transcriptional regulator [Methanosarcina sp.]|nr:helix-turn-helix transcriptional regulator [Methanosarcina sp.]